MELDETDNVKAVYTNEAKQYGGVLSQRRGNTSHYHHHDALGSTRFLTDSSGNVTDTYLNDAWGNSVASTGSTVNPFKWVGRYGYYTDSSTGQVYVRARMYQPAYGEWTTIDPLFPGLPQISTPTLHQYLYADGRPIHEVDLSGLLTVAVNVDPPPRNHLCGGASLAYSYFDLGKHIDKKKTYVVVQMICALRGWVADCKTRDWYCCDEVKPTRWCKGVCFLEIIGGKKGGDDLVRATDDYGLPSYSHEDCSSRGSWVVSSDVRVVESKKETIPVLKKILESPRLANLDNGCLQWQSETSGAMPVDPTALPDWWTKKLGQVSALAVTTTIEWSCCGGWRHQVLHLADGNSV